MMQYGIITTLEHKMNDHTLVYFNPGKSVVNWVTPAFLHIIDKIKSNVISLSFATYRITPSRTHSVANIKPAQLNRRWGMKR